MNPLRRFNDIHTHRAEAATTGRAVVSIRPGETMLSGGNYSVGIHPWDTVEMPSLSMLKQLVRDARQECVLAIGECGFDRLRGGTPEVQRAVFDFHVRLAERLDKPLVIHSVRATDELMGAVRRFPRHRSEWIVHGFRGKPELARQLLRAGFSLSLGPDASPTLLAAIPPDRLYRETD